MGDYGSKQYGDSRMQIERYYGPGPARPTSSNPRDFRSYSASYASASSYGGGGGSKEVKFKKGKSIGGSSSKSWNFTDPEFQRKRRVASYKVYSVEGKVKGSFTKSFRWLKDKYTRAVYGWW